MKNTWMACGLMVALVMAGAMLVGVGEEAQAETVVNPYYTNVVTTDGVISIDGIAVPGLTAVTPELVQDIRNARAAGTSTDADVVKAYNASVAGGAKSDDPDAAATAAAAAQAAAIAAAANTTMGKLMPKAADFEKATHTTITSAKISNLMSQGEKCSNYQWSEITPKEGVCCWQKPCPKDHHGNYIPSCRPTRCWANKRGWEYAISYWEPSEVIEVSCRSGFSMLKPGGIKTRAGSESPLQTCQGFNKPGNQRWFFEARVWAVNGGEGNLRFQSGMGAVNGQRDRQCDESGDDTTKGNYWGYGQKKWASFTHGSENGPGNSWEAYISDGDASWASWGNPGGTAPTPQACAAGTVDVAKCWGSLSPTGWVSHPNPRIAAATVAWRAHTKALGMKKVSAANSEGYQMMMDFPFVTYAGAYGQSMGLPGGSKKGSECFKPGDAGPKWWGGYKDTELPGMVSKLTSGTMSSAVEVNPGVYIFTIWVKTKCNRWKVVTPGPAGICKYEDKS